MSDSARQSAPATQRNRAPILAVLEQVLPPTGTVLEIASGTGEHAVFFAPRLQSLHWLPSDPNPIARDSITAWREAIPAENLYPPLALDVCDPAWADAARLATAVPELDLQSNPVVAIVNINMIHISPWRACLGLMAGAGRLLSPGGILYLYGPYKQKGQHTAASNAAFDQSLKAQNPAWGVRDLEEVIAVAQQHHFLLQQTTAMPANNLSVIFQRS